MKNNLLVKRGQAGIEYMIIIGFITFTVISIFGLAMVYSGQIKDKVKLNQAEAFATQLINSAETVFFAGEPSKTTVRLYLPEGIENITFESDYLVITARVSSGENRRAFQSKVPIQGSVSSTEGIKKLTLEAKESYVQVS
jgi:hypothetical protein